MKTDKEILFKENQRFRQWWIWLPLAVIDVFICYKAFLQLFKNEPFGDQPLDNFGLFFPIMFYAFVQLVLFILRLETAFTKEGIYVRFFPFHLKFKFIDWNIICQAYIRKYKPLIEYGGWGLRYGFGGTAYNISGNEGLQLEYGESSKLLIGTQKAEEMKLALEHLGLLSD